MGDAPCCAGNGSERGSHAVIDSDGIIAGWTHETSSGTSRYAPESEDTPLSKPRPYKEPVRLFDLPEIDTRKLGGKPDRLSRTGTKKQIESRLRGATLNPEAWDRVW